MWGQIVSNAYQYCHTQTYICIISTVSNLNSSITVAKDLPCSYSPDHNETSSQSIVLITALWLRSSAIKIFYIIGSNLAQKHILFCLTKEFSLKNYLKIQIFFYLLFLYTKHFYPLNIIEKFQWSAIRQSSNGWQVLEEVPTLLIRPSGGIKVFPQ